MGGGGGGGGEVAAQMGSQPGGKEYKEEKTLCVCVDEIFVQLTVGILRPVNK